MFLSLLGARPCKRLRSRRERRLVAHYRQRLIPRDHDLYHGGRRECVPLLARVQLLRRWARRRRGGEHLINVYSVVGVLLWACCIVCCSGVLSRVLSRVL